MANEGREITKRGNMCWRVLHGKECPNGDRCKFDHKSFWRGSDFDREHVSLTLVNSSAGDCRLGFDKMKGTRPENSKSAGREGEYKRVVWQKTKLCINWEKNGGCGYGARCTFAHAEAEGWKADAGLALGSSNALPANTLDTVSRDARTCKTARTVHKEQDKGIKRYFKWDNMEKIRDIYADWIDTTTPVDVTTSLIGL